MNGFLLDLRLVWRRSLRQRLSTAAAIATIAVGVCALAAVLAAARAALVTPFPYAQPERLVDLGATRDGRRRFGVYPADFLAWRDGSRSFAGMAAFVPFGNLDLVGAGGEPRRLDVRWVSANYFAVLGVAPRHGRAFLPGEDQPGRDRVVVLSHRLFTERFAGDPAVVGSRLQLAGEPWLVAGVMAPGLGMRGGDPDVWAPLSFGPHRPADREAAYLGVHGRLAPGVSLAAARAEMTAIGARLEAAAPATNRGLRPSLEPLLDVLRQGQRPTVRLLLWAASLVLLVGVVNYWALLLSRARAAAPEGWLRWSLGASPWRAARLLILDSMGLALAGAVLGGLLAAAVLALLPDLGGKLLYRSVALRLDPWSVLVPAAVAAALALVAGGRAAIGVAPRQGTPRLARDGGATPSGRRWQGVTVSVQVALSVVLLLAALSTFRRVAELAARDLGFVPAGAVAFDLAPSPQQYPDAPALAALYRDVLGGLEELGAVEAAGAANDEPGGGWGFRALVAGAPADAEVPSSYLLATPGYFAAAGLRRLEGRLLSDADAAGAEPVMVVSAALARDLFPGRSALDGQVSFEGVAHRVVGVVADARQSGGEELGRHAYLAFAQHATLFDVVGERRMVVLVRGRGDLAALAREAVRRADPQLAVTALEPFAERAGTGLFRPRLLRQVLALFAAVALALTALGLYGTLAEDVRRRRFELGVRLALGADAGALVAAVVRRALAWAAAGVVLALPLAFAFQGWLRAMLEGVEPWSWPTLATLLAVVAVTAVSAAWLPASRIRRIAPAEALAGERPG